MKAGARRIRFKRNPYALQAFVDNQVAARTLALRPVWYDVLSRVPMVAAPSPFLPSRASVGQFVEKSETMSLAQEQVRRARDTRRRQESLGNVLDRLLPPAIVFPEDEIRATFYAWHPFELRRPASFVESESSMGRRDWSSIHGGPKGSFPLMGEK